MYSQSRLLKKPHEQNLRRAMIRADSTLKLLARTKNRGLWQRHGYEAKDMGAQKTELHSLAQPDSLSTLSVSYSRRTDNQATLLQARSGQY